MIQGTDYTDSGLCMPRVTRQIADPEKRKRAEEAWTRQDFRSELAECFQQLQEIVKGSSATEVTLRKFIAMLESIPTVTNVESASFKKRIKMWLTAVQTESYYSYKTPLQRRERARELIVNLITSATTKETENSWMHLL